MKRAAVPNHAGVAEVLRRQIMSAELPPGTRFTALREQTEQLGVARMTIVQAMKTLRDEGQIEKKFGTGIYVKNAPAPERHKFHMKADRSQVYAMVDQLNVSVRRKGAIVERSQDGPYFRPMSRIYIRESMPFC